MIIGAIIASVGSGLLTRINLTSSTVEWAAYMVVTGLGVGLGTNLLYTALQAALTYVQSTMLISRRPINILSSQDEIPIGNGAVNPRSPHLVSRDQDY